MKSDERMVHMRENQYKSLLETTLNTRDLGDGSSECIAAFVAVCSEITY